MQIQRRKLNVSFFQLVTFAAQTVTDLCYTYSINVPACELQK